MDTSTKNFLPPYRYNNHARVPQEYRRATCSVHTLHQIHLRPRLVEHIPAYAKPLEAAAGASTYNANRKIESLEPNLRGIYVDVFV